MDIYHHINNETGFEMYLEMYRRKASSIVLVLSLAVFKK